MSDLREQLQITLTDAYVVEREIGRGGMATVFLARDVKHQRRVALKVLDPELGAVLGAERFLSEIRVTANLQHPNLLPLFDSGEAEGLLYYVMPFVEGESLRQRLTREKQLPVDEALRIAGAVAGALDYAHAHGVIHRDLKPENILLQHGQPVVADFGIALAVSNAGGARVTQTGLSLGTPQYMSPEQATGDRVIDGRTDVYSLAAVTYEMLAGEPPHSGTSAQAIIAKLMTTEPQPVRTLRPSVPAHAAMAVERGLAKLPADRFASAKEFAAALTNPGFTTESAARAAPHRPRFASRVAMALAASSLVLLVAALWGWLRPIPRPPVLRYNLALDSAEAMISTGRFGRLALSPDGGTLVYVGGRRGGLMVRHRNELRATALPGADAAGAPAFSPDGKHVAFIQGASALMIASLDGAPPVFVTDAGFGLSGVTWGDDDVLYCDGRGLSAMVKVAAHARAQPEPFIPLDTAAGEIDQFFPDALPHMRAVLFTSQIRVRGKPPASAIVAVNPKSGARHVVVEGALRARFVAPDRLLYATTDGTLMAAPFDVASQTIAGAAVVVATGLSLETITLDFTTSASTLAYMAGLNSSGERQPVWVTRDGKPQAVDSTWHGRFIDPSLSPDGQRIALTDGYLSGAALSDVWIKQLDNGALSKLTVEGGSNRAPAWSADGKSVIYASFGDDGGWVREKRADGGAPPKRLVRTDGFASPTVSPDGQWVVYSTGNSLQSRIFAFHTGDSVAKPLIAGDLAQRGPVLSPDGRWIAYAMNAGSGWDTYVSPFPNVAAARWQVSRNGGSDPQWSRHGSELLYRDNAGMLVSVPVSTNPTFSMGKPQALFSTTSFISGRFAVAPDGNRLLFLQPVGQVSERLTFVENWMGELAR
jgi:serine/threonine-protein kinase